MTSFFLIFTLKQKEKARVSESVQGDSGIYCGRNCGRVQNDRRGKRFLSYPIRMRITSLECRRGGRVHIKCRRRRTIMYDADIQL